MTFSFRNDYYEARSNLMLQHAYSKMDTSMERLSTGLRINSAADDASGLSIVTSLISQANVLGQSVRNVNDVIGIVQIADMAIDEQVKILDKINVKAIQAAQDGQSSESRKAIQKDINKLIEELDNIAKTTSYNGQKLLAGSFTNKTFNVGDQNGASLIEFSIEATTQNKIGSVRLETGSTITASKAITGFSINGYSLQGIDISQSVGTGVGALATIINNNSDFIGVRANYTNELKTSYAVLSGTIANLVLNGITIGTMNNIEAGDANGVLVNAINATTNLTSVEAYTDEQGRLTLYSLDGRGIVLEADAGTLSLAVNDGGDGSHSSYGKLSLVRLNSMDVITTGLSAAGFDSNETQSIVNLQDIVGGFTSEVAKASGYYRNTTDIADAKSMGSAVSTNEGAFVSMNIAQSAMKKLEGIRFELGSTQNRLVERINNLTVREVNARAAASHIMDIDFAEESSKIARNTIQVQASVYAMNKVREFQKLYSDLLFN